MRSNSLFWVLLAITCAFGTGAHGLKCKFCQSVNNYDDCITNAGGLECTVPMINVTHLLLAPHNPSLGKATPTAGQYQCFQVNYTTNGIWNYQMGCTFANTNVCDGWKVLSHCKISSGFDESIKPSTKASRSSSTRKQPEYTSVVPNVKVVSNAGSTTSVPGSSTAFPTTTQGYTSYPEVPTHPTNGDHDKRGSHSTAGSLSVRLEVLLILILFGCHILFTELRFNGN